MFETGTYVTQVDFQISYVTENYFELLSFLPLPLECWDYSCDPSLQAEAVPGQDPGLCMLRKHFTKVATCTASWACIFVYLLVRHPVNPARISLFGSFPSTLKKGGSEILAPSSDQVQGDIGIPGRPRNIPGTSRKEMRQRINCQ